MKQTQPTSKTATVTATPPATPQPTFRSRYVRPPAAAFYAGVCPRTFQNWMKRGVVSTRKIGRCVLVDLAELDIQLARFKRNANGE